MSQNMVQQGQFLVRALFLACRGPQREGERGHLLVSLLRRTLILLVQGPTLMTSFNINYLHICLQTPSHWRLGASLYEWRGGPQTFSP